MNVVSIKKKYLIAGLIFIVLAGVVTLALFLTTPVPDFRGKDIEKAWSIANSYGLNLKVTFKTNPATKGTILGQNPSAGQRVRRGATVQVAVSRGLKPTSLSAYLVKVPSVVGLPLKEASRILTRRGLTVSVKKRESQKKKGTVIAQHPSAGTKLFKGWPVTLLVSKGVSSDGLVAESGVGSGLVICIDPGHQAKANLQGEPIGPGSSTMKEKCRGGASGVVTSTPEYKITLQIALKLEALLGRRGFKVVMTRRTDDVSISNIERAQIANRSGAALFIRIHCNGSGSSSSRGVSTLYPARNQWTGRIYSQSKKAAQIIQTEVVKTTGQKDGGIVARGDITGFNWSKVPAVLVETGYLSNPGEDRLLNSPDFQLKLAQGMEKGIIKLLRR